MIPHHIRDGLFAHARAEAPNECCGLLAGHGQVVSVQIALTNALCSPTAYFAEPRGLFAAFRRLRAESLELLAIYHSHPASPAVPSRRDLDEWQSADAAMLIISLAPAEEIRGWCIAAGQAAAARLEWTNPAPA